MEIIGNIDRIIFKNLDTGYTVLELNTGSEVVVLSGKLPIVGEGERLSAIGDFQITKYGDQFVAKSVKVFKPFKRDNLIKYLSSGLISGVGPVTAKNIVDCFGEETLEIIHNYPELLSRVKGISKNKAISISNAFNEIEKMQHAVMFLQQYDIPIGLAVKIYECYKQNTEFVIQKNPYQLVEDIDGVGFKTADKIAVKIGIPLDSEFRIRAAFIYVLESHAERMGSTIVDQNQLLMMVCEILGTNIDNVKESYEKVLVKMIIDGVIKEFVYDQTKIGLTRYINYEKIISKNIFRLLNCADNLVVDIDADIAEFETKKKIKLHLEQKNAIKLAITQGIAIITGGPGTGKTTIIKCIIDIFDKLNKKCILMAPTGRAAKRLAQATEGEAGTIHRWLDSYGDNGFRKFRYNELEPLNADVIIVDEVSMLDDFLASSLLKAIRSGARLILVGDKDQLPSVGAGNVLADFISSETIPVASLNQIYRQNETSQIVVNAHLIHDGKMPNLNKKQGDFFFIEKQDSISIKNEVVELVCSRLPKFSNLDFKNIQVLCPTKIGASGTLELNQALQQTLNQQDDEHSVSFGNKKFGVGDKVMQTNNNYDQPWINDTNFEIGKGVFNGDIGYIRNINSKSGEIVVEFEDGRIANYGLAESSDLSLAYAITIHKSQGSEFDIVVIPVSGGNPYLFNRNLLYTAVTRAKKMVVLVGKKEHVSYMVWNTKTIKRETMLQIFLQKLSNGDLLD